MTRQFIIVFVIAALINFTIGCSHTSTSIVTKSDITGSKEKIASLVLTNGSVIRYMGEGGAFRASYQSQHDVIVGRVPPDSVVITPLDSVLEVRIVKTEANVAGTVLLTLGIIVVTIGAIAIIALATKQSCPFVYSFDGSMYRFDAEPLGGAITPGLKRTDVSRLEQLKAVDGEYRLMVRNEANETQFTDQMNLLILDHAPGATIVPDFTGKFSSFTRSIPPVSVVDETGRDVRTFFTIRDDVKWQTKMPTDTSFHAQDLRQHLTFTFPKPTHATTLPLLVNAGTAQWGSNMIREMLMLRGDKVDEWYRSIDARGQEMQNLLSFMDREELFTLKVNVREGSSWVPRGLIHAGGPLIDEDRIVEIDVSHVAGDAVTFRIDPPRGYWKIDCINALDSVKPVSDIAEVYASYGRDESGRDITALLRSTDDRNYTMPEVGNQCLLRFPAPVQAEGTERTLYLRTSGYYNLHLPKDAPEQTALLRELGMKPGKIVAYSLERYVQWHHQLIGSAEQRQQ